VRILADSTIVAMAVRALRTAGHDVVYSGDAALLAEAARDGGRRGRGPQGTGAAGDGGSFLTKDHDIGALVHRDLLPHCGVLLVDGLGDAAAESDLIPAVLSSHHERLVAAAFNRAGPTRIREGRG
jgi:hypothetical protein